MRMYLGKPANTGAILRPRQASGKAASADRDKRNNSIPVFNQIQLKVKVKRKVVNFLTRNRSLNSFFSTVFSEETEHHRNRKVRHFFKKKGKEKISFAGFLLVL